MDQAQRFVTLALGVDQNAKRDQIVNLIVNQILALHFLVDAVKMLRPAGHLGVDAFGFELLRNDGIYLIDVFFPIAFLLRDVALELVVNLRVEILERQIFELALDPGDSQPVRQGRVNIQRFLGGQNALLRRHMIQGAHVVDAIGELDQNHPHVLAHGKQHLAEVLRLLFLPAAEVGPAQLGHAVDQRGDLFAKQALHLIEGG